MMAMMMGGLLLLYTVENDAFMANIIGEGEFQNCPDEIPKRL